MTPYLMFCLEIQFTIRNMNSRQFALTYSITHVRNGCFLANCCADRYLQLLQVIRFVLIHLLKFTCQLYWYPRFNRYRL